MLIMYRILCCIFMIHIIGSAASLLLDQCVHHIFTLECTNVSLTHPLATGTIIDIETIIINNSQIVNINKSDFMWFSSLNTLTINNSYLINVKPNIFEGMAGLNTLTVHNSGLQKLYSFTVSMKTLDLSNNKIGYIATSALSNLSSLRTLKLSGNRLKRVGSSTFIFPSGMYELYLDRNEIEDIDSDSFSNCTNLKTLSLSYNRIFYLPIDIFHDLRNLKVLRLENNAFSILQSELFSPLKSLKYLSLHNNRINHPMDSIRIESLEDLQIDMFVDERVMNISGVLHCVRNSEICTLEIPKLKGSLLENLTSEEISNFKISSNIIQNLSTKSYDGDLIERRQDWGDMKLIISIILNIILFVVVCALCTIIYKQTMQKKKSSEGNTWPDEEENLFSKNSASDITTINISEEKLDSGSTTINKISDQASNEESTHPASSKNEWRKDERSTKFSEGNCGIREPDETTYYERTPTFISSSVSHVTPRTSRSRTSNTSSTDSSPTASKRKPVRRRKNRRK